MRLCAREFAGARVHVRSGGHCDPWARAGCDFDSRSRRAQSIWRDVAQRNGRPALRTFSEGQGFAGFAARANDEGRVCAPVAEELSRYIDVSGLWAPAVIGRSRGFEYQLVERQITHRAAAFFCLRFLKGLVTGAARCHSKDPDSRSAWPLAVCALTRTQPAPGAWVRVLCAAQQSRRPQGPR